MKTGITERLWQLGVGMLSGWVVLDLFLLAVLKNGGRFESWHAGIWITATFFGVWMVAGGRKTEDGGRKTEDGNRWAVGGGQTMEDGRRRTEGRDQKTDGIRHPASGIRHQVGVSGILTCIAVLLPVAFSWILSHFTDFSWDGMTKRSLVVRQLMLGESADPHVFSEQTLMGFLAFITNNWSAGKGLNLVLITILFFLAPAVFTQCGLATTAALGLALLAALNPVCIYQSSTFLVDGQLAVFLSILMLFGLKIFTAKAINPKEILLFSLVGLTAVFTKKTGLLYVSLITLCLLAFMAAWNLRGFFRAGVLAALVIAFGLIARQAQSHKNLNIRTTGYGIGGGASQVAEYESLPRLGLFMASAFSMTEGSPNKINLKPPFWTTRREIRIFEDLFPDPRAGGFGPFYSTAFLLAGLGCLGLVAAGKWKYAPGWFLVLASFGSSYFSQIWWARWTPQNWLLVVGMLMPLLAYGFGSSRVGALRGSRVGGLKGLGEQGLDGEEVQRLTGWKGCWVRTFAVLGMIAAFLNVGIIALYYGIGMVRQERILDSQMYVASQLPQPLPIYLQRENYVFIASKYWLEERGISTQEVAQNVDKPRMKINRTHTRFPLPENWRSLLRRPEDEMVLRKRGLVED